MKLSAPPVPTAPSVPPPTIKWPDKASAPVAGSGTYATVDIILAGLAVGLGFLIASFAARNSDVWLHLASGKRLLSGDYSLGSDPFSYSAASRVWVNHNWLFDLAFYMLYRVHDAAPVLVKALAVAGSLILVLGIRRPGYSFWPWSIGSVLALVAASPRLTLSPAIGSFFMLAIMLFLLLRLPGRHLGWRFPLGIGVTFLIWANIDEWFILGPIALGLVLIGESVRNLLSKSQPIPLESPLGSLPPIAQLSRSLIVGITACCLTPHHVRVWELPFEIIGTSVISGDKQLHDLLTMSPLDSLYRDRADIGRNVNGLAYALLLISSGLLMGLSGGIRAGMIVLWASLALLSFLTVVAIPFFCLVSIPIFAASWNVLSVRVSEKSRVMRLTSILGRVASVLSLLVLLVAAWPGWLAPRGVQLGEGRRVGWGLDPDREIVSACGQLQSWREQGLLPADSHGLIVSVEVANYCAWYAPSEKVFINGRLNHHRQELPGFVAARADLGLSKRDESTVDAATARGLANRTGIGYLVLHGHLNNGPYVTVVNRLWSDWLHWNTWFLDGRTTVFGFRPNPDVPDVTFDRLLVDPVALALDPTTTRLPKMNLDARESTRDWRDTFFDPVKSAPPEADAAFGWLQYRLALSTRQSQTHQAAFFLLNNVPGLATPSFIPLLRLTVPPPPDGSHRAIPLLAARYARLAIAANPEHPDGYWALAQALTDPNYPAPEQERAIAHATALRQTLNHMPQPAEYRDLWAEYDRSPYLASPTEVSLGLFRIYLGQPLAPDLYRGTLVDLQPFRDLVGQVLMVPNAKAAQRALPVPVRYLGQLPPEVKPFGGQRVPAVLSLDLARQELIVAGEYATIDWQKVEPGKRNAMVEELKKTRKQVETSLLTAKANYETVTPGSASPEKRYIAARDNGLTGEAIRILKEANLSEFQDPPRAGLERVALEIITGRIEDASHDLDDLRTAFDEMAQQPGVDPRRAASARNALVQLSYHRSLLLGDFTAASADLIALNERSLGQYQMDIDLMRGLIGPYDLTKHQPLPFRVFDQAIPLLPMFGEVTSPAALMTKYFAGRIDYLREKEVRQLILNRTTADREFFYKEGVLSLLEGDIPSARERFRQAATIKKEPVPGWIMPPVRYLDAEGYLRMIDRAGKKTVR